MKLFDENNITVAYVAKLNYESQDEEEMQKEFTMMKTYDPRIILSHVPSSTSIACWLHRTGFTGPQYVLITLAWLTLDPGYIDIPVYWPWCTKSMVLDVTESLIIFADGLLADIGDDEGPSLDDFHQELMARISDATETDVQDYFLPIYYDRTYAIGLILNETEHILQRERNETLSDWLTNTENFQQNGSEIVKIIKRACLDFKMTGFKGHYQFKNDSGQVVSNSFLPVVLTQIVLFDRSDEENVDFDFINVAHHNIEEGHILHEIAPLKWRTFDGLPPRDSLTIYKTKVPMIPIGTNVVLKIIASLLIIASLALGSFITAKKQPKCKLSLWFLIIGDCLLLSHCFFVPTSVDLSNSTTNILCFAISFAITIGFAFVFSAFCSVFTGKCGKKLLAIWIGFNVAMAIAICLTSLPLDGDNWTKLDLEFVPNKDMSQAHQPSRLECVAIASALTSGQRIAPIVLLATLAFGNLLVIAKGSILAFKSINKKPIKMAKKTTTASRMSSWKLRKSSVMAKNNNIAAVNLPPSESEMKDLKRTATCLYCQVLVAIAVCFISVLAIGNNQFLLLSTSFSSIVLVLLNLSIVIAPKAFINEKIGGDLAKKSSVIPAGSNLGLPRNSSLNKK